MSPNEEITISGPQKQGNSSTSEQNQLTLLLQKIIGQDSTPDLTSEQIDKIIDQRSTIASYVHADKKRDSFDYKFVLIVILLFILLFSALVLWKYPDTFPQVLSLIIGLLGGGAGGYGLGTKSKS